MERVLAMLLLLAPQETEPEEGASPAVVMTEDVPVFLLDPEMFETFLAEEEPASKTDETALVEKVVRSSLEPPAARVETRSDEPKVTVDDERDAASRHPISAKTTSRAQKTDTASRARPFFLGSALVAALIALLILHRKG